MEQSKQQQPNIVDQSTVLKFNLQLSIITKIIRTFSIRVKHLVPKDIAYKISVFVFRNPLKLRYRPYSLYLQAALAGNVKYMLTRKHYNQFNKNQQKRQNEIQGYNKYSSYLTITKQWKAIAFSELDFIQILVMGKNFAQFLSSYRITPLGYSQKDEIDPLVNFKAYEKQQKLKSLQHCLIGDDLPQLHQQIQIILNYDKDRKLNDNVINSFTNLMKKNIAVVKIQQNFDCKALGCQGKFLYFQNRSKLPLTTYKQIVFYDEFGWLQIDNSKRWRFCSNKYKGLNIYKPQTYPLSRKKATFLVNTKLQYFVQKDIWIEY